jgi:hypothetical protein
MFFIHLISWLILIAMVPVFIGTLWIKHRSSISCWIRRHRHPERWLLSATIAKESSHSKRESTLRQIVEQARNLEWAASCAYQRRDPQTGEWILGLIANNQPLNSDVTEPFTLTSLPPCQVIRLSGQSRHEGVSIEDELHRWCQTNGIEPPTEAYSLTAQSFQCHEWELTSEDIDIQPSFMAKLSERILEMRDIVLYPTIFTIISAAMLGTGSIWFFGIGIFIMILMSGACKFVFLHQRVDITQESHLQNY